MKRIIYTREDGKVCIVCPSPRKTLAEVAAKAVPDGVEYKIVDLIEIPTDRTFRDAWKITAGKIGVDMAQAKAQWVDKVRPIRDRELAKLDVEYMRQDEAGDATKKAEIATRKQALRDLPATFADSLANVKTPDKLKTMWPDGLPRE